MSQGERDLENLARLLYTENRQDLSPEEAAALIRTVYERQGLEGYPSTVEEVLTQPNQYHGFSPPPGSERHAANTAAGAAFGPGHPEWEKYITLAQYGYQQAQEPMENAPTHYFTGEAPGWAKGMQLTDIGRHKFGREERRPKREVLGSRKRKKSPPK